MVAMTSGRTAADHRIDHQPLEHEAERHDRDHRGRRDRGPERAGRNSRADQHEERRQHDEFALGEIDGLRRLPEQREADRHQRVDRAGGEPGYHQLQASAIGPAPGRRTRRRPTAGPPSVAGLRPYLHDLLLAVDHLGKEADAVDLVDVVPVVSIRIDGSSLGVIVGPCMV